MKTSYYYDYFLKLPIIILSLYRNPMNLHISIFPKSYIIPHHSFPPDPTITSHIASITKLPSTLSAISVLPPQLPNFNKGGGGGGVRNGWYALLPSPLRVTSRLFRTPPPRLVTTHHSFPPPKIGFHHCQNFRAYSNLNLPLAPCFLSPFPPIQSHHLPPENSLCH